MARDIIGVKGETSLQGGIAVNGLPEKEHMYKAKRGECTCESDSSALET